MKQASGQWLESAEMDLGSIGQIIQREDLTPIAAFHAQQCVEKCFKAVLEEHSKKVPKEHSTLKLYGLDDLYIEARYPGELGLLPNGKPSLVDAQQLYDFARNVYEQVKRTLGG